MSTEPSEMQQFEALLSERDVLLIPGADEQGPQWKEVDASLRALVASLAKDKATACDLRSCAICRLTVDVSKSHVAPDPDFSMRGRVKTAHVPMDTALMVDKSHERLRAKEDAESAAIDTACREIIRTQRET